MIMKKDVKKQIDQVVKDLKKIRKVQAVILFGSYAKGTEKPISDIDIAVIIKNSEIDTEVEVTSNSSDKLQITLFHRLPLYIQFEVFKYGKMLFVKNGKMLFDMKRHVLREYLDTEYLYRRMGKKILA